MWRLEEDRVTSFEVGHGGQVDCASLGLRFGLDEDGWLRVFEPDGRLVPTPDEAADLEQFRAERSDERAEREFRRAARTVQRSREGRRKLEQERARADTLEQEVSRLRTELAARNGVR